MPYKNIADAKEAGFPTKLNDVALTISQVNVLAEYYDSIKKSGDVAEPMAAAIAQWKKGHHNTSVAWIKAEVISSSASVSRYDPKTHVVKAVKVGTIGSGTDGSKIAYTAGWLAEHAKDWTGGKLIANHYGADSPVYGKIVKSWWEDPYGMIQLGELDAETERRMEAGEHTGFSVDATCFGEGIESMVGTNLSILFYPHIPACPAEDGCGITLPTTESRSSPEDTGLINNPQQIGSESMVEKTYTDSEIQKLLADQAKLTTFESEAKTHESTVNALQAELAARSEKISEMTSEAEKLFTADDVAAKVAEAQGALFTSEDVEKAKTEAIESAIKTAKEEADRIATETAAFTAMFPDGMDETFKSEVMEMIKEGKTHDAFLKIGTVEFKSLKPPVPTATGETPPETDDVIATVGSYDPSKGEWV